VRGGDRREKKSSYEQCINKEYIREARADRSSTKQGLNSLNTLIG
jgi:hypothetical protein